MSNTKSQKNTLNLKDGEALFKFRGSEKSPLPKDDKRGGYRQESLIKREGSKGDHEHKWSHTTKDGKHQEGYVGENVPRVETGKRKGKREY